MWRKREKRIEKLVWKLYKLEENKGGGMVVVWVK
jgi:hypothetical protein